MAKINRYDTPSRSNYFNTFIPLPLDQITALGMKRQEDFERKQDLFSRSIDEASMIDYTPGSIDEYRVKNEFLPQIQKLAEEAISMDLSNPVEWAKYSTKIKRLSLSDDIKRIEQSAAGYKQYVNAVNELKLRGLYNPYLDDASSKISSLDSRNKIFDYIPEAQIDKTKLFEPYYSNLAEESRYGILENGLQGQYIGVSKDKVQGVSGKYAQELLSTPGGQQIVKLAKATNSALKDLDDIDILRMEMDDYGMARRGEVFHPFSEGLQGFGRNTPTDNLYDLIPVQTGGKGIEFDPAGAMHEIEKLNSKGRPPVSNITPGTAIMFSPKFKTKEEQDEYYTNLYGGNTESEKIENKNKAYEKIITKYPVFLKGPDGKELTKEETINNYKTAVEDWNKSYSTVYSFGNKQVNDEWNRRVAYTLKDRSIIIPGKETPMSPEEVAKYYGYELNEFVNILADPNNPSIKVNAPSINARGEGWSSIQIIPKNGKSTFRQDILISSSEDETPYMNRYYNLQNAVKSDNPIPTIVGSYGDDKLIVALPVKRMGYNVLGRPTLDISINEYITDMSFNIIGEPIEIDKSLNDYYKESIKALTRGLHLDRNTTGLTMEQD